MGRPQNPASGEASEGKKQKKRKAAFSLSFASLRFGNWLYPSLDVNKENDAKSTGLCEVRISYTTGKISYEFPFSSSAQPQANRALIEFSLSSITAIEVDEEAGSVTFLLSVPPFTYLGSQGHAQATPDLLAPTVFETVQYDFSQGPVKLHRSHTLGFAPLVQSRSSKPAAPALARPGGGTGGFFGLAVRKFVASLCQDDSISNIIEQDRQAEPGGNFPLHEIDSSMRPAIQYLDGSKTSKSKRRASAADALDGSPKKKRSYKPRAPKVKASTQVMDPAGAPQGATSDGGVGEDDEEDQPREAPATVPKAQPHVLDRQAPFNL